jgi:DNA-directed RNA polymerase subunit RPC12/RpoP
MGSCYSIQPFIQEFVNNNICILCSQTIQDTEKNKKKYIKCDYCQILIHYKCALKYKFSKQYNDNEIICPNCSNMNTLFIYNKDIRDCEKL